MAGVEWVESERNIQYTTTYPITFDWAVIDPISTRLNQGATMRNLWRNGLVLALLLIVGCFDPSDSILEPGSLAVVATEKEYLMFTATGVASLDPGVMVRIGHDPGVYRERDDWFEERVAKEPPADAAISRKRGPDVYPNGTELSKLRDVKVTVESGRHKDASGKITRKDLRPSK